MADRRRRPTDLRRYARGTQLRLAVGALALLFVVGGFLIYLFYGPASAALGWLCLIVGLLPVGLIVAALWIADIVVRRSHDD
jgi:hypothetical protein